MVPRQKPLTRLTAPLRTLAQIVVGKDLAAALIARLPIAPNEMISFYYDTTEDDLRGDRGGFICYCGAANCRGEVWGKLYSPQRAQAAAAAAGGVETR